MSEKQYIKNMETGKIELHFTKQEYQALPDKLKKELKSHYLFSKYASAWVSRSKNNTYWAIEIAKKLGFVDGGKIGDQLSYEEQLQVKADKAERRAERYEQYADNAVNRGKALQAEREKYRGDISFWTQPIISGHAGSQSFAKYRQRIVDRYHKGFEEYRKSEYFKEKSITAQSTAEMSQLKDPVYLHNRIEETNKEIRRIERQITTIEQRYEGEQREQLLKEYLNKMEWHIDKLSFLQNCFDEVGGNTYNSSNIKPGYFVKIRGRWDLVLKANKKTVYVKSGITGLELKYPYAEIQDVKIPEGWQEPKDETKNPFNVGDIAYYTAISSDRIIRAYQVIKATNKTVTIRRIDVQENKPVKDYFTSEKTERRAVKEDRSGNIVVNYDNWYLYKYAS